MSLLSRRLATIERAHPAPDPAVEEAVDALRRIFGLTPVQVAELRETSADVIAGLRARLTGGEPEGTHTAAWRRCACAFCQDVRKGYGLPPNEVHERSVEDA